MSDYATGEELVWFDINLQPTTDYATWRAKTDPLSKPQSPEEFDFEDYYELSARDPDSILARDLKLEHIRRFGPQSTYEVWAKKEYARR